MQWIDTHAHLYSDAFDEDREKVIQRALEAGVTKILLPNIDRESVAGMHSLSDHFPETCFPMMGLHPCSVSENWEDQLAQLKPWLNQRNYFAIGEIGIDLYWDTSTLTYQQAAFSRQIEWSLEYNLPIVIHARDSFREIFEVLTHFQGSPIKGVFHCFTGGSNEINTINSLGNFYFGLGGVSTYPKAQMDQVIPHLPKDKILLETDAPYLSPVPKRGKRNESSYLLHTAEKVAEILSMEMAELAELTTANAQNLFQWK